MRRRCTIISNDKVRHATGALVAFMLLAFAKAALGVEVDGVHFADRVTLDGESLLLNGVGTRRVTIFNVKVYVAGLYIRERTRSGAEVLRPDRRKYFVAVMKRDVSRDDTAPIFREGIERSARADSDALRSEILAFERWIPSMREGQQLMVAFTPSSGVAVRSTAKGEPFRGSIRFGTALFGMWIGPRAKDTDLRESLLRGLPRAGS